MASVLVLRTCNDDMTSHNGFRWPESGPVEASDWTPTYKCGNGLHGLLWGEGNGGYLSWYPSDKWIVVRVDEADLLHGDGDLRDKCKFRRGIVVFCGDRLGATEFIKANGGQGKSIVGATATAGNYGTATSGYRGTAAAGNGGTATAGNGGTATAGNYGTATAGNYGTATSGDYGTAAAGNGGTAAAGNYGTATAGDRGTAAAGDRGTIALRFWDTRCMRYRILSADVGENGIEPNVQYHVVGCKIVRKD